MSRHQIKKVALVTPHYHSGVVETAGRWPNIAFIYFAGALREAGFEPLLYDAMTENHDLETIGQNLKAFDPDLVLTTAYTPSYPKAVELLRHVKEIMPDVITGIGGVHAHFMYEEVLGKDGDVIDFVFRGEGEETIPAFVVAYNAGEDLSQVQGIAFNDEQGNLVLAPPRPFIHDLDGLTPAWDLVKWDIYEFFPMPDTNLAIVSSSRGCNQACTFCSQQKFWQRSWRARSPENFVDELQMLKEKYGVGVVMLSDETPTIDRERWEKILDLLIEREVGMYLLMETRVDDVIRDADIIDKYAKAGVHHVYVGVERTDQATLDLFKKDTSLDQGKKALDLLNAADIITETSFIMGLPGDTTQIIRDTFKQAQYYNPDLGFFLTIAPWPYADNYPELEPYVVSHDYEDYNLVAPVIKPTAMTTDELMSEVIDCYKNFYMGKLEDVPNMTPFKQRYYMITMKLLMENSYLTKYMGGMGEMPESVNEMLADYIDADAIKAVEAIYTEDTAAAKVD